MSFNQDLSNFIEDFSRKKFLQLFDLISLSKKIKIKRHRIVSDEFFKTLSKSFL